MDGADVAVIAEIGAHLLVIKLFVVSITCVWIYDYFLTLGDEIKYAWAGKRSWVFALFIATRYIPILYVISLYVSFFHHTKAVCYGTKWIIYFHNTVVAVLAQIILALRIYAVTERNKWLGGLFSALTAAQLCFGTYFTIWSVSAPLGSLPEIDLDAFRLCTIKRWRGGELIFGSLMTAFDVLAFLTILIIAKRTRANRYPGIPSILDVILRDATLYFILMFGTEIAFQLFFLVAPNRFQPIPGLANTIFIPLMASHIMLSLKKAATDPTGPWSLATMADTDRGRSPEGGTLRFTSWVSSGPHQVSETLNPPSEVDIEIEFVPR
ncbi:hypothetical protein BDM02DRAFT_3118320 [Thelephora ganbajun]|uniref:Uncharacterized protein n=1 Tax=Thelephora ganbajun TaxID=370292 RepID=A0ACB6ZAL3_THEGA|nr:hypothetical protein BDM02DRAFT_3118320 [Thelephora ganbajun]